MHNIFPYICMEIIIYIIFASVLKIILEALLVVYSSYLDTVSIVFLIFFYHELLK